MVKTLRVCLPHPPPPFLFSARNLTQQAPNKCLFDLIKNDHRAGDMAQDLRAFAAPPEDLGLVPSPTSIGLQLPATSTSGDLTPSSGLCGYCICDTHHLTNIEIDLLKTD